MKTTLKNIFFVVIALLTSCNPAKQNTLKVKFNASVSERRVFEFTSIESNQLLQAAITEPFLVKQAQKEIPSQLFFDPVSKTHSLLIYPNIDNKSYLTFTAGNKSSVEFQPMAHAELWEKTGGQFIDHKYVSNNPFVEVDSVRVPDGNTDNAFFFKYEGPGWESNLVGYRFYLDWRNANDIFGKRTEKMVLENAGMNDYDSYHNLQDWGMDIFKVGASLGIGSIGYWNGKSAERVAETDSVICKILAKGPIRAMIQTNYYGWQTTDFKTNFTSYLSIDANSRLTKQVLLFDKAPANICTGIIKDTTCQQIKMVDGNWTAFGDWGKQSLNKDNLGLVIFVKNSSIIDFKTDDINDVVVIKPENNQAMWYFGAAWELETNGIKTIDQFKAYISSQLTLLNKPDSQY